MKEPRVVPAEAAVFTERNLRLDELAAFIDEVIHRTHICMRENSTQGTTTLAQSGDYVVVSEVEQRRYTSKPSFRAHRGQSPAIIPRLADFDAQGLQRFDRRSRRIRLTKSAISAKRRRASEGARLRGAATPG
jgi:phosphopantetheine adenylyltransferase